MQVVTRAGFTVQLTTPAVISPQRLAKFSNKLKHFSLATASLHEDTHNMYSL